MIKWCLNLKLLSTSSYHALRTSGFVTLPSERTLRDYTSYFYVLVLMVHGILFKMNFPYAHFGTQDATGDILFSIVWEAIRHLEAMSVCNTADRVSANRKFFRMHYDKEDPQPFYKTRNVYSPNNQWLFLLVIPHI